MTTTDTRTPIRRRRWALATGAVLALALIGGAAAGGATLAGSRTTVIRPAAATAPAPAASSKTAPPAQAQAPHQAPTVIINNNPPAAQPAPPAPAAPAGTYGYTYAGDGVWAGPNTSAPFALAVHQAWLTSGEAGTVEAYSPVTNQWYVMTQTGSDPYVYQGGNGASVEFWS